MGREGETDPEVKAERLEGVTGVWAEKMETWVHIKVFIQILAVA